MVATEKEITNNTLDNSRYINRPQSKKYLQKQSGPNDRHHFLRSLVKRNLLKLTSVKGKRSGDVNIILPTNTMIQFFHTHALFEYFINSAYIRISYSFGGNSSLGVFGFLRQVFSIFFFFSVR